MYDLQAEKLDEASGEWKRFGSTRVEGREYEAYMTRARMMESRTYRFRPSAWYKLEDGAIRPATGRVGGEDIYETGAEAGDCHGSLGTGQARRVQLEPGGGSRGLLGGAAAGMAAFLRSG